MATSSTSLSLSTTENYQLFSYASKLKDNRKITTIIENYLAPASEMDSERAIQFMPDVIRLHQLTGGAYSLATRYSNPTFTYLRSLRELAVRMFCQDLEAYKPTPKTLRDKSDIEWPCRDEVLAKCDVAYGRSLITLMTERFTMHSEINIQRWMWSSMHIAVSSDDAELVKYMIEQRCSLDLRNIDHCSPLVLAIGRRNNSEAVQLLVDARADIELTNEMGDTPLIKAACLSNLQAVRILLTAGANVEHANRLGSTPLLEAAFKVRSYRGVENCADSAIVKALVDAGASINRTNQQKNTPLMLALKGRAVKAASYLISRSDVNMRDCSGTTALMDASLFCPNLVDAIIKKGALVNLQNDTRDTALLYAALAGHEKCIESLLAAKADPTVVNSKGKRAIDYANGNARIIAMLTAPRSV